MYLNTWTLKHLFASKHEQLTLFPIAYLISSSVNMKPSTIAYVAKIKATLYVVAKMFTYSRTNLSDML